jgi:hypothetical protein
MGFYVRGGVNTRPAVAKLADLRRATDPLEEVALILVNILPTSKFFAHLLRERSAECPEHCSRPQHSMPSLRAIAKSSNALRRRCSGGAT